MNGVSFWNLILGCLLSILTVVAFGINLFVYHYPGNNYFPPNSLFIVLAIALMYVGFRLQFGREGYLTIMLKEVVYFCLVVFLLAFTTTGAQFTPFRPIDSYILQMETFLGINLAKIMAWTSGFPWFTKLLETVYDTLPFQMSYIPLVVIVLGKTNRIREYYFLLLFSALIGFVIYYFFPTTGPASVIDSPFFTEAQIATGLKFNQIHHHISPSTMEGGMVALPSFHVIWAWYGTYLLRDWKIIFFLVLVLNILLTVSCIALGWHYPLDLIASVIIIILSHVFYGFINNPYGRTHTYLIK